MLGGDAGHEQKIRGKQDNSADVCRDVSAIIHHPLVERILRANKSIINIVERKVNVKDGDGCLLFTYDKKSKKISNLSKTTLKEHNIFERKDLEKWIEDSPLILNEELLILSTEYDQFDKTNERLDLLAMDKVGNLVIVELKRDDSGRNVELQAIKYAAYCSTLTFEQVTGLYQQYHSRKGKTLDKEKAKQEIFDFVEDSDFKEINEKPRIILVSKEYRPEVTASVLWLRKFGIDISCVKLTPYDSMIRRLVLNQLSLYLYPKRRISSSSRR